MIYVVSWTKGLRYLPNRKQCRKSRGIVGYVTTGILQIRLTDDGDRDVAGLAIMYIAEVPNESSVS